MYSDKSSCERDGVFGMITKAMPSLNYTTTNMIPLQSINMAITIIGVVFILVGIAGILWCWLQGRYTETEEEDI